MTIDRRKLALDLLTERLIDIAHGNILEGEKTIGELVYTATEDELKQIILDMAERTMTKQ